MKLMVDEVNVTTITLVKKKPNICSFLHFSPLSICKVLYRFIAKKIVNRIKPMLSKINAGN